MLRSIIAVILGYVVMFVLTMAMFGVLAVACPDAFGADRMQFPALPIAFTILGAGFVLAGVAGYVTAWIAQKAEMKHVLALCGLVLVMSVINMVQYLDRQPLWYLLSLTVLGLIGAYAGGMLRVRQR